VSSKITYFLGAGASAKALPTTKSCGLNSGLSNSMKDLAESLLSNKEIAPTLVFQHTISKDLKWLADKSDEYETVDTFAKYLYISGNIEELNRLKKTLSIYFAIEQITKLDKRYIIFLTSIIGKDQKFPEDIKLISWNYDFQMQNAAEEITSLHFYPNIEYFKPGAKKKEYNLIQLNGIAGFDFNDDGKIGKLIRDEINSLFDQVMMSENKHLLTFAWENGNDSETSILLKDRMNLVKDAIKDTEILVIIGYSFPFFNRDIDKEIFNILKPSLKKIYYQDPDHNRSGEFLRNQFVLPGKDKLEIRDEKNCDQFFVPFEL